MAMNEPLHSVELCAGAGGQALGLEGAGFSHVALVEIEDKFRETLKLNRPNWNVIDGEESDIKFFNGSTYKHIDLLAGGLPCPPFSVAGKQLGADDERDLFPHAIRIIDEMRPRAIMIENVRGFLSPMFESYRAKLATTLKKLGYSVGWKLQMASDFGVPQLRPRVVIVAIYSDFTDNFEWPGHNSTPPKTVGETLFDLMSAEGWRRVKRWKEIANSIAPTIVGGSKKHGGPDLGPTRARMAWEKLGVDGKGIADAAPSYNFQGMPRLTNRMAARIQGFPDNWEFAGSKTSSYRQIGNAFPPPVAKAVGVNLRKALMSRHFLQVVA